MQSNATRTFLNLKRMRNLVALYFTPQFPVDLVLFAEEILNEKLHFWCCNTSD